ncbi:MAG: hypothetical protein EXR99_01695 [Gemmataceae bacterium]|nr:hypothetical protein [Gemmataceae bacterium]
MKSFVLSILGFCLAANLSLAADWSHWRGPGQNGVALDTNLPEKWSPVPGNPDSNLHWSAPYGGRTTPLILNNRVFIINKDGAGLTEQERVMCFSFDTGKLLWEYKFNVFHTDIVSVRLGWTTLAGDPETGNVYAHGTQGLLFCFDKDGKILWTHSLTEEFGRISGYGGRVTSPIIDENLLIIGMINASWGGQAIGRNRFVAFDKKTGQIVWWSSTGNQVKDTYYSCPVVTEIAGQRLLVSGGGDGGVHAFKVRTGEKVWSHLFGSGSVNCSPVVNGNLVFIGQGEENIGTNSQGRVICLDGSQVTKGEPKVVWQTDGIKAKFASPVFHQGRLYVCGEVGSLHCLDAADGKEIWKFQYGRNTKGSPVLADGKIYLPEVDSKFHILKPGESTCRRIHQHFFRGQGGEEVQLNGSPAIADGKIVFMTSHNLYCIGTKNGQGVPTSPVKEKPRAPNGEPAHIQIFPADAVIFPNSKQEIQAIAYDKNGNRLGPIEVAWSLAGPGAPEGAPPPMPGAPPAVPPPPIQAKLEQARGKTTSIQANSYPPAQFGRVLAKAGNLTGEARIRVAPILPYAPDFSKIPEKRTPGGWINCQGKFEIVKLPDGRQVLKKLVINPSPLAARANVFITTPDLANYTIEAEVLGKKVKDDLPDMGIIANRYSLILVGETQSLRLVSWDALPRVDKTITWKWEPETWYHMKLSFEQSGNQGVVRGKVWARGKPEPAAWTLEVTDPIPNVNGSAGIYANAKRILENQPGTEIFFDNVRVTPNK